MRITKKQTCFSNCYQTIYYVMKFVLGIGISEITLFLSNQFYCVSSRATKIIMLGCPLGKKFCLFSQSAFIWPLLLIYIPLYVILSLKACPDPNNRSRKKHRWNFGNKSINKLVFFLSLILALVWNKKKNSN